MRLRAFPDQPFTGARVPGAAEGNEGWEEAEADSLLSEGGSLHWKISPEVRESEAVGIGADRKASICSDMLTHTYGPSTPEGKAHKSPQVREEPWLHSESQASQGSILCLH